MRDDWGRVKLQLRGSVTELDLQSRGLGSTPAPLSMNCFFVLGLAGLKFSAITLNRQLVVYSHLLLFFFLSCYVVFELFVSNYNIHKKFL